MQQLCAKRRAILLVACKSKVNYINQETRRTRKKSNEDENTHKYKQYTKYRRTPFYEKKLTVDGKQINFVIDSGSPITIIPNHLKPDKPLQTVEQIYTEVNKNRVELDGKCMVTVETPTGPKPTRINYLRTK